MQTSTPPEDCQDSPLPRPVPDDGTAPVTGEVAQAVENNSIVEINYTVVENSSGQAFTVTLPSGAKLVNQSGFSQDGDQLRTIPDQGDRLTLRYALTKMGHDEEGQFPNASYTAGPEWIIAPTPEHGGPDVTLQPAASGFIGLDILYLGEYTRHSTMAGCQNITIIKPEATGFDPEPRLNMLSNAAASLSGGTTYSTVYVFPSPKPIPAADGFVPEFQNNIIIEADASIHSAWNVWIHEYIHTRQVEYSGENFSWFQEASATYYAAQLTLEQGLISPIEFDAALARYAQHQPTTNLATAESEDIAYRWGAVVLARLDASLWQRGHTLAEMWNDINQYDGPSYSKFERQLSSRGLSESRLNETRAIVERNAQPDPSPVYTSRMSWLPGALLAHISAIYQSFVAIVGGAGLAIAGRELWTVVGTSD